jgi:hypothetical protein
LFEEARSRFTANPCHLRIPETLANLWLGIHYLLKFSLEVGACSAAEAERLEEEALQSLVTLGEAQGKLVEQEQPAKRFLSVLSTLLTQGKVVLFSKSHFQGLIKNSDHIGWQDNQFIYLIPDAAFQAVVSFCRESGEVFITRTETLRRDLARLGLLEQDSSGYTRTVRFGGSLTKKVLQLRRGKVEELIGEQFPTTGNVEEQTLPGAGEL